MATFQEYVDVVAAADATTGVLTGLGNVRITVFDVLAGANATIYSDQGITPKGNPFTTTLGGKIDFFVADGRQYRIDIHDLNGSPRVSDQSRYWIPGLIIPLALSKLTDPTTGKVIGSSGGVAAAVNPPGFEIGYDQFTANVGVSSTSESSPNSVLTCAAHTFDGGPVMVEVFAPSLTIPSLAAGAQNNLLLNLWEGGTNLLRLGVAAFSADTNARLSSMPMALRYRFTPSAGSHTYNISAWILGGAGTISAGTGAPGSYAPGFVRFTKI